MKNLFIIFISLFAMFATFFFLSMGWIAVDIPFATMPDSNILISPLERFTVTSPFGYRVHPVTGELSMHNGIDLSEVEGTPIYAVADGVVMKNITLDDIAGNYIKVKHENLKLISGYLHLQHPSSLPEGSLVRKGDIVGYVGNTGRSTGPHLHFSLQSLDMVWIDPAKSIDFNHPENIPKWDYLNKIPIVDVTSPAEPLPTTETNP